MTTKLALYNQALLHIKESPLGTDGLLEIRESRYYLDVVYADVFKYILESGFWKFAMRTVQIDADTAITPAFGLPHAFNMPEDWVKTYQVSGSPNVESGPPLENWVEEANCLWANINPIYLRYVSNSDTGYGGDLSRWTAKATFAFATELGWRIVGKATGMTSSDKKNLEDEKKAALSTAISSEALREPTRRPQEGRWAGSRGGSTFRRVPGGYVR
jgi:hypothetical protein